MTASANTTDNQDLVFQPGGRRPPGAGAFVQHVYGLLADEPDGLDRQQIVIPHEPSHAVVAAWLASLQQRLVTRGTP